MEKKINALFENEMFTSKLAACVDANALKALFVENGVDFTDGQAEEKINALLENEEFTSKLAACLDADAFKALFSANGVELDDESLQSVAGGSYRYRINDVKKMAKENVGFWKKVLNCTTKVLFDVVVFKD